MPIASEFEAAADRIQQMIVNKAVPIILGGGDTVPYVGLRAVGRKRT